MKVFKLFSVLEDQGGYIRSKKPPFIPTRLIFQYVKELSKSDNLIDFMNVSSCIYSIFSVVFKECD